MIHHMFQLEIFQDFFLPGVTSIPFYDVTLGVHNAVDHHTKGRSAVGNRHARQLIG
jgi:hypothetical protein